MCGIAGLAGAKSDQDQDLRTIARRMCQPLQHRGPDGEGVWADADHGVALGHRRLAILDLSPQGAQPMTSMCGRFVIVYNGEIYNHLALRHQLPDHPWRGHSDTETVLALFSRHGVCSTLPLLTGMFAMAVWDRQLQTLTLARDRMGEKPLYWGHLPHGSFAFASELGALRAHPQWRAEVDRQALALFTRYGNVPAPRSIYRGFSKLLPGSWLRRSADGRIEHGSYWNAAQVASDARRRSRQLSDEEAVERLDELLRDVVRGQLIADVPLGAFLSGGVDSSTIVALMAQTSSAPVKTFTIGFGESGYNEAEHAKAVARHLGTHHTELYVEPRDALEMVPRLSTIYDEPFADASQIPTALIARMARRHVTVALSGDAGDELFAGYSRYEIAHRLWRALSRIPLGVRESAARMLGGVPVERWDAMIAHLPRRLRGMASGDRVHKLAQSMLAQPDHRSLYHEMLCFWPSSTEVVIGSDSSEEASESAWPTDPALDDFERMCLFDQQTYLPNDILVKLDRASMAASLETRVPLLDHRVFDFAWSLPMGIKRRDGRAKWVLRQVLRRYVPASLFERPKQGFSVPLDAWLRGPLREWAEAMIAPQRLAREGFFDPVRVREAWEAHLHGHRRFHQRLWCVLMFQGWLETTRGA